MSFFEPYAWFCGCVLVTVNCKATTITPLLAAWLEVTAIANIKPCMDKLSIIFYDIFLLPIGIYHY